MYDPRFSKIAREGPLHISHATLLPETRAFRDALTDAWISKGHELNEDIYNGRLEGLAHCVSTVYEGVRSSSAVYVTGKENVEIMHSTVAIKINLNVILQ